MPTIEDTKVSGYYEKIISTAWMVAHCRTFSDIPYSKEIFERLDLIRKSHLFNKITEEMKSPNLAPQLEARYKLLDRLIIQNKNKQILEIASGFAPRGLELAKNKDICYVELDLQDVIKDKQDIINSLTKEATAGNLHLVAGNALEQDSLLHATNFFDRAKPITITHEGLLRYLSFDEKSRVADNIHRLLDIFGGVWITSDISLKAVILNEDKHYKGQNMLISTITNIDIEQNLFEDEIQAKAFFENLGFDIERHSYLEVQGILVSPKKLHMSEKTLHEMLKSSVVYVMRLKEDKKK